MFLRRLQLLTIAALMLSMHVHAEGGERQAYIEKWKDTAIEQMEKYGIPASITLAQGILESGNGKSMLTREANNHFGIKCHGWDGPGVYKDDDKKNECFRKYRSAQQSFEDHSQFLLKKRYAPLFELKMTDYKGWARGLKKAGYATDPAYAKRLISLIEDNELDQYDDMSYVEKKKFKRDRKKAKTEPLAIESTDVEIDLVEARRIEVHPNKIKFVKAKEGDDVRTIANAMDMAPWQIKKYNDLGDRRRFKEGEIIYLQPKKKNAKVEFHVSLSNETLRQISQNHGVALKRLVEYNSGVPPDKVLPKGQQIRLRKARK